MFGYHSAECLPFLLTTIFLVGSRYTLRIKVSETEFSEFVLPKDWNNGSWGLPPPQDGFSPPQDGFPPPQDDAIGRPASTQSPNSLRKQVEVISNKLTDVLKQFSEFFLSFEYSLALAFLVIKGISVSFIRTRAN